MDGGDIAEDFHNKIAAEIRLPEALNRKLLSPFQYFALSDTIDLSNVQWRGKYEIKELTKLYTENDRRVSDIIRNCEDYLTDINDVQALGFCVSQGHAMYMAEKFTLAGLKANYLVSSNSSSRDIVRNQLLKKKSIISSSLTYSMRVLISQILILFFSKANRKSDYIFTAIRQRAPSC